MYLFYIDESGSRDPEAIQRNQDGTKADKDPLYVLTAVSLFEWKWRDFDKSIASEKLSLSARLYRDHSLKLDLADCEIKSTWLRHPKLRQAQSRFLHELVDAERTHLQELFYKQLQLRNMQIFSVVIDKRKLLSHMDHDKMHKKAYELLLERIESFLREYHPKHQGILVIDDTDKTINRSLSMKHAYWQREGNQQMRFSHIVEYPFFSDSKLSNGIQLADLCGYNVYRAFTRKNFSYQFFYQMLPYFYTSLKTPEQKLDGLKVWPDDSELVQFASESFIAYKTKMPGLFSGHS